MSELSVNISTHYLYPSALHVPSSPCRVTTVLGSCVAVCLYDNEKKIGGINHYMLPLWNGEGLASPKFGNVAIEKLYQAMVQHKCKPENIVAKVFGGANQSQGLLDVGGRNIQIAKDILRNLNIKIVAENTGGSVGRKLVFETHTGQVLMKFLNGIQQNG